MRSSRLFRILLALAVVLLPACGGAKRSDEKSSEKVLRVIPQADLEILDPTSTTGYLTRDHGYMIYDTLFGVDDLGNIRPQMVDTYDVSPDRKTWTFTLRDGLEFHDGQPVTSEDVVASIERWAKVDTLGQRLKSFVTSFDCPDAKTFRMTLHAPFGLVLESLGKPQVYVPFIYPKRLAISADKITEPTGSGPFIFKKDEWRPGEKAIYVRNPRYRPRPEPASGTAGGKVVKVDRVEWVIIKDPQTQANALMAGEVDMIAELAPEQYSSLKGNTGLQLLLLNPEGYQYFLRFNHQKPPFDNPEVRRAAMAAMNQAAFLRTQVAVPELFNTCFSIYACTSPYFTQAGADFLARPDMEFARKRLKESGYRGEPIVVLRPTDLAVIARLPIVAAELLRKAGFTVDVQSVDMNTLLIRRAKEEGWNIFLSYGAWTPRTAPVSQNTLSAACKNAWYGWPCDKEVEELRDAFAIASTDEERKAIAERLQVRVLESGTHVPLGEFRSMTAARKSVTGFIKGTYTIYWNLQKQ